MSLQRQARVVAGVALMCLGSASLPALAADASAVTVRANMARILRISAPAATVIVGNPGIADVTIQDPQTLVLTGKSFGQTNLIVLDGMGNPIADTLVEVTIAQSDTVTVYLGSQRTSMSCTPRCNPTIMMGDDPAYTTNQLASSNLVRSATQ
ncbi:Pilus formation protein N terminal region [Devosia enhydra]|uniref:Pilus formation protein N terminal region n=1 Tax=Devosia enhydra TaxID=665118 RepID=A0A1K2I2H1_9HYPH|nr:pilus assembly protein N-terminal domain-containing protein [Devosia enhydra]SFZ86439.1 Pilus formation protein N terminal region [Devosia enhydra]